MNTAVASTSITERGRALLAALTALFLVLAGALIALPATADDEPSGPHIVVSKTTGLNPGGETITVTGSGFVANPPSTDATRAPVGAGNFGGVYVVFGKWSDDWAPSADGTRPSSGNLSQRWGVHEAQFGGSINAGNGGFIIPEDGSFELTFTVADSSLLEGNYGIYSYAGGGAVYAPFETFTPLTFLPTPEIVVSKSTGLDPEGETITVTGSGFVANPPSTDATRAPVGAGNFGGVYVVFGKWSDDWAPSQDGSRPGTGNLSQRWGVHEAQFGGSINAGNGGFIIPEDGSFELTFTVTDSSELDGNYGIYSYAGGGAVYAPFETFTPLTFTAETEPGDGEPGDGEPGDTDPGDSDPGETDDTEPATPATPSGGSLRWAISSAFTDYVVGPIAKGEIIVSGGATRAGGQFQFGQASASGYNSETGFGTVSYTGTVRYTGHSGGLDVTVSNPRIVISSASTATIFFTYEGASVAFATLNLAAGTKSTNDGAVTYTAVPTSLTVDGRERILGGFATTLSPLTFTIGSAAPAPAGSTGTVARASTTTQKSDELPATPPTSTGIAIDDAQLAALTSGEQASFEAPGFQPNEQDIKVVVYSTPVLLGTVTADAEGIARWTGTLPATLAEGEHTLTLQGSVVRGLAFTLNRVKVTQVLGECVATGATLKWGFKETFRVYLEGIAKGGWELDGIRYDYPDFVWADGTGSYSASTRAGLVEFDGSLRFHGHDGALNTTLKNARIELSGDTGYLIFDVSGETQGGADVDAKNVRFAQFSLAGVSPVDGTLTLVAIPAVLTAAGADAFGTYPAGEALDPISAIIPVGTDCGTGVEEPVTTPEDSEAHAMPLWPWVTGGIVLAALIAAGVGFGAVRRRRAETSL